MGKESNYFRELNAGRKKKWKEEKDNLDCNAQAHRCPETPKFRGKGYRNLNLRDIISVVW
jgi:hypothetical protein